MNRWNPLWSKVLESAGLVSAILVFLLAGIE
jgi:hypothetical protein